MPGRIRENIVLITGFGFTGPCNENREIDLCQSADSSLVGVNILVLKSSSFQ
jgi:hypothetical protein